MKVGIAGFAGSGKSRFGAWAVSEFTKKLAFTALRL